MNGSSASYNFAIKSLMKAKPYSVLTISLLISVAHQGYCLRIFERPLSEDSGQNFDSLINTTWNVLVTMTTVGYGDFFPKTNLGRIIGIVIAFWGQFSISLFVVSLSTMLEFDSGELRAFQLGRRLDKKDQVKIYAANVLSSAYR